MTDRDDAVPTDPSRNATTHGLTARRPLCEQEAERLRVLVDSWTSKHLPETEAEEALVQSAAVEYVRYLRCVQADERALGPNAREALGEWQEKRRHAIRRKAQDLRDDPARVAAELHESAFGIDWLLGHWRRLLGLLDAGRPWSGDDLITALALLGRPAARPADDDVDARALYEAAWLACPTCLDIRSPHKGLTGPEAVAGLRSLLLDRIARLEVLRPFAWEEVEAPQAEAVEASAMVDTSKDGQLRQRYRREALRDLHRGVSLLLRLKVERSRIDDRQARQGRRETASRLSGFAADRRHEAARPSPAAVPPSTPGADAPSAPVPQRNDPPGPRPTADNDRRNPNQVNENEVNPGERSPAPPRRTEAHPGAHPTTSGGPPVGPTSGLPGAREAQPCPPGRPATPDRAA